MVIPLRNKSRFKPHNRIEGYSFMMVLSCLGLALLVVGGIVPTLRQIETAKTRLAERHMAIDQQKTLAPVDAMLRQRIDELELEFAAIPEPERLQVGEMSEVPGFFRELAVEMDLQFISATPQLRALRDGRDALRLDVRMRGNYDNMRRLLLRLAELPYVEGIDGMSIHVIEAGKELQLTIWLGLG